MEFCIDAGSRSLSDDGLQLNNDCAKENATMTRNALKNSSNCNLAGLISKENDSHNNAIAKSSSFNKVKLYNIVIEYLNIIFSIFYLSLGEFES